jgi:DNA ligase-4
MQKSGIVAVTSSNAQRHITDGEWKDWDPHNPPTQYIELAGGESQHLERPDQWIMPDKLIRSLITTKSFLGRSCSRLKLHKLQRQVFTVRCTAQEDQFRTTFTLRFPRFQRIREDKDWKSALSYEGEHYYHSSDK